MAPQVLTDDIAALDAANNQTAAAHATLDQLTEVQIEAANAVGVAVSTLSDLSQKQADLLDKTIADLEAAYGQQPPPGAGGPVPLMAMPPDRFGAIGSGPFAKLWAWIQANPDKALKLVAFLAALFGIPIPMLQARINDIKAGR